MDSAEGAILVTHEVFRRTLGVFDMEPGEALKLEGDRTGLKPISFSRQSPFIQTDVPTFEDVEPSRLGAMRN